MTAHEPAITAVGTHDVQPICDRDQPCWFDQFKGAKLDEQTVAELEAFANAGRFCREHDPYVRQVILNERERQRWCPHCGRPYA